MFEVGDKVKHKSGGHVMVVKSIDGEKAVCEWTEDGAPREETFDSALLEKPPSSRYSSQAVRG